MGSSEDEEPEEAEKSKESLAAHGYTVGKTLGAGSYSTVKLVSKEGATYACKIISKEKSSMVYRVKFLPRELKILGSTRHPHITQIFTIIEEPSKVFIIMEMACGGDLLEKILKVKRLDERTTHQFFMQLASALAYLHKNDVAHRDLKCENVLLTTVDVVKLTDFSFARYCTDERTKRKELSETFCGSEAYAAPEILQGICYLPKLADVWSLGVILYVMVTGLLPYESNGLLRQVRLQMTRTVRFPKVLPLSTELKNLIRGMLEPVVTLRASMARVVRHPWIKKYPSPFKEYVSSTTLLFLRINRKIYAYEAAQQKSQLEPPAVEAPPPEEAEAGQQAAPGGGGAAVWAETKAKEEDAGSPGSSEQSVSSLREPARQEAKEDVSIKEEASQETQGGARSPKDEDGAKISKDQTGAEASKDVGAKASKDEDGSSNSLSKKSKGSVAQPGAETTGNSAAKEEEGSLEGAEVEAKAGAPMEGDTIEADAKAPNKADANEAEAVDSTPKNGGVKEAVVKSKAPKEGDAIEADAKAMKEGNTKEAGASKEGGPKKAEAKAKAPKEGDAIEADTKATKEGNTKEAGAPKKGDPKKAEAKAKGAKGGDAKEASASADEAK